MSFDREPGPDDGSLPPVDIVVPNDARALARDVLAYRREMRSRRRQERLAWLVRRLGLTGHESAFPLIAACVALALLAGTMLSVTSIGSGSPPLVSASPQPSVTSLPVGEVRLDDARIVPTTALDGSLLVLVAPSCSCGTALEDLARQAKAAEVPVYFIYDGRSTDAGQRQITARYGDGVARTVYDFKRVFFFAFATDQVTALVAYGDGIVHVVRALAGWPDLPPALRSLRGTQ